MVSSPLYETLRLAQRFGFFGPGSLDDAISHAEGFVPALGVVEPGSRIIDLGSGGGLPGLVVAEACRDSTVVLLDRRQKRTDFLLQAVSRLGWDHVMVWHDDAERIVGDIRAGHIPGFDLVVARGFGPPATTLRIAVGVSVPGASIVISEPPSENRWDPALVASLGLTDIRVGRYRRFHRDA
ncbi:MAG: hypothetical protein CSA55_05590 [Ilumatobacter coccineus]|uniref:Glucose-inhibited division protein B n=1 Tax=Ilumatobacter coccineus TaxID=467094 RepID=A0A2G6K740_9ACTN|nr:MAG: hypothetical protein CSA55_05590 [Ilumatobacter coccineus]